MKTPLVKIDAQFGPPSGPWPPPGDTPTYTWLDAVFALIATVMLAFFVFRFATAVLNALDGIS